MSAIQIHNASISRRTASATRNHAAFIPDTKTSNPGQPFVLLHQLLSKYVLGPILGVASERFKVWFWATERRFVSRYPHLHTRQPLPANGT